MTDENERLAKWLERVQDARTVLVASGMQPEDWRAVVALAEVMGESRRDQVAVHIAPHVGAASTAVIRAFRQVEDLAHYLTISLPGVVDMLKRRLT